MISEHGILVAADPNTKIILTTVCKSCKGEGRKVWNQYSKIKKKEVTFQTKCERCHRGHLLTPDGRALLDFVRDFGGQ